MAKLAELPTGSFADATLRGVGQVMLQNNPLSGALFLVGIFLASYVMGLYALLGTVTATAAAMALGVSRSPVSQGVYGFNGTLVAIGLAVFVRHTAALPGYVIFASVVTTIATAAIHDYLCSKHIPTLTAPFVVTAWVFVAGMRWFGRLAPGSALAVPRLPAHSAVAAGAVSPSDLLYGFFNGFSEVFLQAGLWTGVAFLAGILVNSRISALAAALGSLVGFAVAWGLGSPETALRGGLFGYDAVLTAIALGGLFYLPSIRSALFTALAAAVSVVVYGMFETVLAPIGLPVVTAPFVVTTWLCLLGATSLAGLQAVRPEDATTPEGNLRSATRALAELHVPAPT